MNVRILLNKHKQHIKIREYQYSCAIHICNWVHCMGDLFVFVIQFRRGNIPVCRQFQFSFYRLKTIWNAAMHFPPLLRVVFYTTTVFHMVGVCLSLLWETEAQ